MTRSISCLAAFWLSLWMGVAPAGELEKEQAAIGAAEKWPALVHDGKYEERWKETAEYFRRSYRDAVKKGQWEHQLQAIRKPPGKLFARDVKNSIYLTALPGAPDGQCVVIQFKTSFERKESAVETVTPMLDKDGKWRVSGCCIK